MKFFRKTPSADAILVQELQLALVSAQETNLTLQHQLKREIEAKTAIEMALYEADHRSKTLRESLNLSNKTLSVSRAEVRALKDLNHGLRQENQNISVLQEEMVIQKENFKTEMEAMKSSYGQVIVENDNFQKKIEELEGQLQKETEAKTTVEMALYEADHRLKTLQDSLDLSNKALSASRAEVRELQDQNNGLHQENQTISALQEEIATQENYKMKTIEFKVKAFEIIKHLESSLTKQKDISTKHQQELLKKSEAVTEQSQRNQTLEKELMEVREKQEKTSKTHGEERSVLHAKVAELYENLEESVKVICDLKETKDNLIMQRNEQLKWITESENTIKQLREELRLKNEPQETQVKQSKDTWKTSGRKWRR